MQQELKTKNIVLAGFFDPSAFDKLFFVKNEILNEDQILAGSIFDGNSVQLIGISFHILVLSNQVIITDLKPNENTPIDKTILSIISAGKISKVIALGINFHWFLEDKSKSLEQFSKDLFYNDKIKILADFFKSANSAFGVYASTDFMNARMKLDVKPNTITEINQTGNVLNKQVLNFAFNFHFEIKNPSDNSEMLQYISEYNSYKQETEKIMSIYI